MEYQDTYTNFLDQQSSSYLKELSQIKEISQQPYNQLSKFQMEKLQEEKEISDELSLLSRMRDHYIQFRLQENNSVMQILSKTIFLGPISMIKPLLFHSKDPVLKLRSLYETILAAGEIKETQENFAKNLLLDIERQLNIKLQDKSLQNELERLFKKVQNITKEDWLHCLGQVVDHQTIQEITQTNIDFEISGGSDSKLNLESDGCEQSEKKGQFNYDGDEERTPQQSEHSEQEENQKGNFSWKKMEREMRLDSAGYEASNSDRSKKQGKIPRLRNKKKGNQEFDTDKEREKTKK